MPSERDRREGWKHAKISGHKWEEHVAKMLDEGDPEVKPLKEAIVGEKGEITKVEATGKNHADSILNDNTTTKADILVWVSYPEKNHSEDTIKGISVKKSEAGQVWLVTFDRYVEAMQYHGVQLTYGTEFCLRCLTGETDGKSISDFAPLANPQRLHKSGQLLEIKDNRLVGKTLAEAYPKEFRELTDHLTDTYRLHARLCFFEGLCLGKIGQAEILSYRSGDVFTIEQILELKGAELIHSKSLDLPSTIWLPFGFLQAHRPTKKGKKKEGPFKLQFHHKKVTILENL